ncbi:putative nonribosomal peptide synthase [Karstenula rhodostoma CBS 690.94]|uniref:Nonribosomal peptide synthase n=1 Tax=Karstenula rhodostoma CBS 690.94 TaxID=1392251 RepID=A0A9P4UBL3_9PLEO|nr:putative nonribosomal peptide synthase [Karstenula rhodostoma CBS 690.94]
MAIVSKMLSHQQANAWEKLRVDDIGPAPWVVVSGALSLLLSVYSQGQAPLFHARTDTPAQSWNVSLQVDQDCTARELFKATEEAGEKTGTVSKVLYSFSLCMDSLENWTNSKGGASDSDSEEESESLSIPRQIFVTVEPEGEACYLTLESRAKNSQASTRFLDQLAHVIRQLLAGATDGRRLRDLDLISATDRQDLQLWNQHVPSTIKSTIHEIFAQRVLERPSSQAVESWDGRLSYQELDSLSSRVSTLLLEAGVRPRDVIPLCFEKSLWTIVAMFGVLKSGCAFLLLDVSHPTTRLETLSKAVGAPLVLSSCEQRERARSLASQVIVISGSTLPAPTKDELCHVQVSPSDVGAIIFTSGTTGTPKGIQLEHKSMCSSLMALSQTLGMGRHTRYFQFSSYAFDAAFGEILMTLFNGGCICIPSEGDRLNKLAESIRFFNANTVLLTPTVVRLLSPADVPGLTTLISGGERVTKDIIGTWGNVTNFWIVYGPAEITVGCVAKRAFHSEDESINIGRPVNSRIWITRLDDPNKLAPVGVLGEVVVEGPGVARNYINNSSDSGKLFIDTSPWAQDLGLDMTSTTRCYRTGDLASFAENGEIIFVGRRDRQVKLRGQRIELEDIEAKLQHQTRQPGAHVVLEVLDISGTANLVAFLQHPSYDGTSGSNPDGDTAHSNERLRLEIAGIRTRISEELPSYMWPVVWIPLKELPLSPSGKLDRRALLRIGKEFHSSLAVDGGDGDDLSPVESVLAGFWKQLLQFSSGSFKPDAHFFKLGGDSLRSMKLITMVNQAGYHLTMEKLFKNPTIAGMATAMQKLPDAVADQSRPSVVRAPSSIGESSQVWSLLEQHGLDKQEVAAIFPCSPLQEGLFSLSLALTSLYSSQFVFDVPGTMDIQKFRTACESAINVFPILRTTIVSSSSGLIQVVLRHQKRWTEVTQELAPFLAADKTIPFTSGQPLARYHYVHDPSTKRSHVVWTLHHAVFDGWSLDLVVDHLRATYSGNTITEQPTRGFEDFVQLSRTLHEEEASSFWKEQLQNAPASSFPNLPKPGYLAADNSCLRHKMATPAMSALGTTATVMARASLALLLSEYEGSDDITFGNSLHGRSSLPDDLQNVMDRAKTISGFLDDLQEQYTSTIPYEQFGLSRINAMGPDVKNAASFRTLLIVQIENTAFTDGEDIKLKEVERSLHEYPLVLTLVPGDSQTELIATFDSTLISPQQTQRILQQFEQVFYELSTRSSDTKLGELDLASKADKTTMFWWNARSHRAFEVCVHEMIREHVKRSPNALAIYSKNGNLDYATLDKLSDAIAGQLKQSGVAPGSVVGVLFEKSSWALVSTLAVIKAGCAFAPLSPTNPRQRLLDIAEQANIKVVLCSAKQQRNFPGLVQNTIVINDETIASFQPVAESHRKIATPDSMLYVLSTSGTTGTPKVFAVQHKSFASGALARAPLIGRNSNSRVLQFAPFNFDPSVEDILTTFMFGGCVCLPSEDDIMGDISAFMKDARVNFANITPSVADTLKQNELPDLEILLLSGESPHQALIDKWDGKVQLMNGYGPSECSVKCSINRNLTRNDPRNIGHSVGTSVWVLKPDNHNLITPLGAVGELVIESPNLAIGYMNRPEVTREKFIDAPSWLQDFREGHVSRMYKTGDLVRYLEDGSVSYIGRGDLQLKVNGQRLEAEEVRHRIQDYFAEDDLVVLVDSARFEGQQSDILIAYLASKSGKRTGAVDLDPTLQQRIQKLKDQMIRHLGTILPKYMIPSVFLAVTNIPVTTNGKADRRTLKALTLSQRLDPRLLSENGIIEPPTTEGEKLLHGLWQNLLGLKADEFGANAHFFELAGSSLMAIRMAAALRDRGQDISARKIFENPILSDMASQMKPIEKLISHGSTVFSLLGKIGYDVHALKDVLPAYSIKYEDIEDAYPCTRQQQRYVEEEGAAPGGTTFRHIVSLPADIDLTRLETTLRRIVQANSILRTRILLLKSHPIQIVLKDEVATRNVETLSSLVREDREISWGLGQPQSRFSFINEGQDQPKYLVWSCTHVVFDGWCRKLLLEDIDYAYHHDAVPPSRPGYNQFIDYVYGQELDATTSTLIKAMEEKPFLLYFRLDGTRVPTVTHFATLGISFPSSLPLGISYATVLLTAWSIAAAYVEKHNHLLYNILLGGRDAALTGIDSLMGPTSTTAPLAVSIDNESTLRETMENIHKRIGEAGSLQHTVDLGDQLKRLLRAAPTLVVHPADDYVESSTKNLGLVRSRAEMVQGSSDALFMNFCLRTDNAGVDLVLELDEHFFSERRATRYLDTLECILAFFFTPGGMDLTIKELDLDSVHLESSVSISTDIAY